MPHPPPLNNWMFHPLRQHTSSLSSSRGCGWLAMPCLHADQCPYRRSVASAVACNAHQATTNAARCCWCLSVSSCPSLPGQARGAGPRDRGAPETGYHTRHHSRAFFSVLTASARFVFVSSGAARPFVWRQVGGDVGGSRRSAPACKAAAALQRGGEGRGIQCCALPQSLFRATLAAMCIRQACTALPLPVVFSIHKLSTASACCIRYSQTLNFTHGKSRAVFTTVEVITSSAAVKNTFSRLPCHVLLPLALYPVLPAKHHVCNTCTISLIHTIIFVFISGNNSLFISATTDATDRHSFWFYCNIRPEKH
jgi:hypothetical protein